MLKWVLGVVGLAAVLVACEGSTSTTTPWWSTTTAITTTTTPGPPEPVVVGGPTGATVLSGEVSFPQGFVVPAGEVWAFDPEADTTVTAGGNVEVRGILQMQPVSGDVAHVLRFEGVDESRFVGGGMSVTSSDVGLWVMGEGQLVVEGEEKVAWSYEWQPEWTGDEVIAAPHAADDYDGFEPVSAAPPPNSLGFSTELLNLTRNVRIEGTPGGYAHVFIRSTRPQTIRYATLRYMGPGFGDTDVTGRYGLHFHFCGDGSRGSVVQGVVVRDSGNHAFVPHASHGITFHDTIAYQVANEAYWWDSPEDDETRHDTHDVVWDRAVAARVDLGVAGNDHRLTAFYLGRGINPTITNSVAVGVQGSGADRSGYQWPESGSGLWTFADNLAHNNEAHGIFVWQNNSEPHHIDGFTAYYNEGSGVSHGAYGNSYQYRDLVLVGNGVAVTSHALGKPGGGADTQIWTNVTTGDGTLFVDEHARPGSAPVRFIDCDFGRVLVVDADEEPSQYDFIGCGLEPADFDLTAAHPGSIFRVERADGTAYRLLGSGTVTDIPAFSS